MSQVFYFILRLLLVLNPICAWSASHHPQDFLKQIAGAADEGEQIVQHYCANCHAEKPLIPIGAPRIARDEDWKPRLKQSLNVLLNHTMEGLNAMPPRGGCFECTDEQLMLAVLSMLPEKNRRATELTP